MDVSYLLFLQSAATPRPEDPSPEGGEREHVGDDDDDMIPTQPKPRPLKPQPATPDANPIDPRVFSGG